MKKILLSVFSGFVVSVVISAQVGTFDPSFNQGFWGLIGTSNDYLRIISTGNETCILTRNEAAFPSYPNLPYSSGALASLTNVPGSSFTSTDIGVYTGSGQFSQVTDVYKASNGKIYAVGYEKLDNTGYTNPKFFINRYSAEGLFDTSFNNGQTFFIEAVSYYYGVKVRPLSDNKILIAGNLSSGNLFLLRFNENGTPDSSFGTNGLYAFNFINGFPQYITDMMVLSSGKILIAGRAKDINNNGGFEVGFVARLNADGSLDNTFGTSSGYTPINFGDDDNVSNVNSITLTSTGDILAVGGGTFTTTGGSGTYQTSIAGIAKLDEDGAFVNTFGTNGIYKGDALGFRSEFTKVRVLSNGDILTAGRIAPTNDRDSLAFVFFTSNGSLNTNYSTDGIVYFNLESAMQYQNINDFDIQPDGKVIFLASIFVPVYRYSFIGRMLMDEPPVAGLEENSPAELSLYPNPTSNFIQLNNSQPMQIKILDISGKVVKQSVIQPNAQISVETLSNGMYFISTEKGGCLKFIKK